MGLKPAAGGDHLGAVEGGVCAQHPHPGRAAAWAVASASATNRAAPFAELVDPLRSRVAQITGAADGVETVAISAFSPFTPV
jgi:hypothetical protein